MKNFEIEKLPIPILTLPPLLPGGPAANGLEIVEEIGVVETPPNETCFRSFKN